jgi:hypothetical protein
LQPLFSLQSFKGHEKYDFKNLFYLNSIAVVLNNECGNLDVQIIVTHAQALQELPHQQQQSSRHLLGATVMLIHFLNE